MSEYPDSKDIEKILNWDGTPRELCEFVVSLWAYPDRASFKAQTEDAWGEPETGHHILSLSTGGWSGNEEIVDALDETWFACMFKSKWVHGGHYWYEIGDQLLDSKLNWGVLRPKETAEEKSKEDTRQWTEWQDFDSFRSSGILWLINTTVFHPRGMALALNYDTLGNCTSWKLFKDNEAWVFPDEDANEYFQAFKNFIETQFKEQQ